VCVCLLKKLVPRSDVCVCMCMCMCVCVCVLCVLCVHMCVCIVCAYCLCWCVCVCVCVCVCCVESIWQDEPALLEHLRKDHLICEVLKGSLARVRCLSLVSRVSAKIQGL